MLAGSDFKFTTFIPAFAGICHVRGKSIIYLGLIDRINYSTLFTIGLLIFQQNLSKRHLFKRMEFLLGGFKYFLFAPQTLGKWSNLTKISQMGWFNHAPASLWYFPRHGSHGWMVKNPFGSSKLSGGQRFGPSLGGRSRAAVARARWQGVSGWGKVRVGEIRHHPKWWFSKGNPLFFLGKPRWRWNGGLNRKFVHEIMMFFRET